MRLIKSDGTTSLEMQNEIVEYYAKKGARLVSLAPFLIASGIIYGMGSRITLCPPRRR